MAVYNIIQKIYRLMTGKRLPAKQTVGSVRLVRTVSKSVEDAETAFREANAARLARAKYDQAIKSDDPGVVATLLRDVKDDGSAGAALLMQVLQVRQMEKQQRLLLSQNETQKRERDTRAKEYCWVADSLQLRNRRPYPVAREVRKKLKNDGQEDLPSVKTIVRGLRSQNYF